MLVLNSMKRKKTREYITKIKGQAIKQNILGEHHMAYVQSLRQLLIIHSPFFQVKNLICG